MQDVIENNLIKITDLVNIVMEMVEDVEVGEIEIIVTTDVMAPTGNDKQNMKFQKRHERNFQIHEIKLGISPPTFF